MQRVLFGVMSLALLTTPLLAQNSGDACECVPKCSIGEVCVKRCPGTAHCSINDNFLIERESKISGNSFTITTDKGITANISIDPNSTK